MAVIEKEIKLLGTKGSKRVFALFDSGASYSCIEASFADELEPAIKLPIRLRLSTAKKKQFLKVKGQVILAFWINGYRFTDEFLVIENLSDKLIIGANTLQKWRMKLDFEKEDVIIDPRVTKLRLV